MGKKNKKTSKEDFNRGLMSKFYGPGKEAQDMLKRYGVEGYSHGRTDRGSEYRGVDEVKKDLAKAMMNDYDTRRGMEAAALMGNKDAKKYANKGISTKNMMGAWDTMKDLKKEYVGGGGMSGPENEAGLTHALVKADREQQTQGYRDEFASKEALDALAQQQKAEEAMKPKEITPSPEMQAAKDRVKSWEENDPSGTARPYGGESSSSIYGNKGDDSQTSASVDADTFLGAKKAELMKERNFKRAF